MNIIFEIINTIYICRSNYNHRFEKCRYDWIEIYDGGNSSSSLIGGKMCGLNSPTTIFSSSNEILIKFRSDNYIERNGYKIRAEAVGKYWKNSFL